MDGFRQPTILSLTSGSPAKQGARWVCRTCSDSRQAGSNNPISQLGRPIAQQYLWACTAPAHRLRPAWGLGDLPAAPTACHQPVLGVLQIQRRQVEPPSAAPHRPAPRGPAGSAPAADRRLVGNLVIRLLDVPSVWSAAGLSDASGPRPDFFRNDSSAPAWPARPTTAACPSSSTSSPTEPQARRSASTPAPRTEFSSAFCAASFSCEGGDQTGPPIVTVAVALVRTL